MTETSEPALVSGNGFMPARTMVRIALVSDIHLTRDPEKADYERNFDAAIAAVNAASPDLILVPGDLTANGLPEQYGDFQARAAAFLAPVRCVPGNADLGDKPRDTLEPGSTVTAERIAAYESEQGATKWAETLAGYRVVAANTLLLGSELPEEAGVWEHLERELGPLSPHAGTPAIILLHYPLFIETFDEPDVQHWNTTPEPRQRFLSLLAETNMQVRAVFNGHLHQPIDLEWNGIRFIGAPAVSFGIMPGIQPTGWTLVTIPPSGPVTAQFMAIEPRPEAPVVP